MDARWSYDLVRLVTKTREMVEQCREDGETKRMAELDRMGELVQTELDAIWSRSSSAPSDHFAGDDTALDAHLVALQRRLLWSSYQSDLFDRMRAAILDALRTAEAASLRSKALKALGQIVERDPSVFGEDDVRLAIEDRFKDTQPSVRDAAFDLLGKHVVYDPALAIKYLPRIGDRITDTGLSVRKRVVKLLKSIYVIVQDGPARADICTRLISRLRDDDDGIKVRDAVAGMALMSAQDLAVTTLGELLFALDAPTKSPTRSLRKSSSYAATPDPSATTLEQAKILVTLVVALGDRRGGLEDALKLIVDKDGAADKRSVGLLERMRETATALVDALVEGAIDGATRIDCVRTLRIVVGAAPSALSLEAAEKLRPLLVAATTDEDRALRDETLSILRVAVPSMPRSSSPFMLKLVNLLEDMLKKPPAQLAVREARHVARC